MAKYQSIYAAIPDRARIVWTFLSFLPAILILLVGNVIGIAAIVWIAFARGDVSAFQEVEAYFEQLTGAEPLLIFMPFFFVALATFFWVRIVEGRSLGTIGFTGMRWVQRYLKGFAIGAAFLLFVIGFIFIAGGYTIESGAPIMTAPDPVAALSLIGLFLLAFLVQGASEEIVFRGWWMSALAARRGKIIAVLVTSVFFAGLHLGNVWPPTTASLIGVANIVLFGIFIGLYALKEKSLWGVCGWHSAWNWLLGLGFGLEVSGQGIKATPLLIDLADKGHAPLLTGGGFGPEASLVVTAVLLVGSVYLWRKGALG